VRINNTIVRPVSYQQMRSYTPSRFAQSADNEALPFKLGQHVLHPKFGEGVVTELEGHGDTTRVRVNFVDVGTKLLMLPPAKLEAI